jgi:hypothetical protein
MKLHHRPAAALAAMAVTFGTVFAMTTGTATAAETPGATYVPILPTRALDTRDGVGRAGVKGPVPGGTTIDVAVTGLGGVPTSGVDAVALNVTATNGTALNSFLTVFPSGVTRPLASNVNFTAGKTVPNLVVARVGTNGTVSIYNNSGTADVIVDVQGWYAAPATPIGARYAPLEPARVLDTRFGIGAAGSVVGGSAIDLTVAGRGGVPGSGVSAVVLNVTVTNVTGPDTFVTVYPAETPRQLASNLNAVRGQTVPNLVFARVNNGKVSLYNNAGVVDLVADVQGWYAAPTEPAGGRATYAAVSPVRALDTRDGTGTGGVSGKLGAGGTIALQVTGRNGVPASGVTAVVLNVTVTEPTGPDSFLTAYPSLTVRPLASNLNFTANQTVANLVVARVGPNGAVWIYNNLGAVHVVADVQGWFSATP